MDEVAFRKANLSRVLQDEFDGNQSALARKLKRSASFINELVNGKRPFGEKIARAMETRLGLPRKALDLPPGGSSAVTDQRATYVINHWPFSFGRARFSGLTAAQREQVERVVLALIVSFEAGNDRPKRSGKGGGHQ